MIFYKKISDNEISVSIIVSPKSSKTRFGEVVEIESCKYLKVYVTAPAIESLANKAIIDFFKKIFKCVVLIKKGLTSRKKILSLFISEEEFKNVCKDLNLFNYSIFDI